LKLTPRRVALASLSVTVACLPLYVVRWHIGPLPTTLLEVLILITVAAYIFTLWSEKRPPVRTGYEIPIALLLIAGVIGIVVSPDHTRALGIYRAYFLEAVACFYVAVDLLDTPHNLRVFLLAAAAGSSVMAAGQIVSFAWVAAHGELKLGDAPSFLNTSANADAMFLEPPLAFALGFFAFPSGPRERLIAGMVLALVFAGIVLTLSRGAYLAMVFLAVVFVLSLQGHKWRLRALTAIAVLGLITVEIPFINHRLADLAHSAVTRESIFRQALQMLAERPIFGAGISGYAIRTAPFRPPRAPVFIYPHDMWLAMWSELGLLGLFAFAFIFFALLWRGARALPRATGIYKPLLWGAVGALVLYAVHGIFDTPYWKNDFSVEFWLLAALQLVAVRATRKPESPPAP
jgi:O-antigen ligase